MLNTLVEMDITISPNHILCMWRDTAHISSPPYNLVFLNMSFSSTSSSASSANVLSSLTSTSSSSFSPQASCPELKSGLYNVDKHAYLFSVLSQLLVVSRLDMFPSHLRTADRLNATTAGYKLILYQLTLGHKCPKSHAFPLMKSLVIFSHCIRVYSLSVCVQQC